MVCTSQVDLFEVNLTIKIDACSQHSTWLKLIRIIFEDQLSFKRGTTFFGRYFSKRFLHLSQKQKAYFLFGNEFFLRTSYA